MSKKEGAEAAPLKNTGLQLLTASVQGALAETFAKERQQRAAATAKGLADLGTFVEDANFKVNAFDALRKSNSCLSGAVIGESVYAVKPNVEQILAAATRHEEIRKQRYRASHIYQKLFVAEKPFQRHDVRDRFFSREKFLSQSLSKHEFVVPLRSSEAIGWLPALPTR